MTTYSVYGLSLESDWPLTGYAEAAGPADVRLREGTEAGFRRVRDSLPPAGGDDEWPRYARLQDGATYLRWGDAFEFLIDPAGTTVLGLAGPAAEMEGFHTYLLGQVLSFALIQRGVEPLHATALAVRCGAVALLGPSGVGKSTVAAEFLRAGDTLLTDDLLVLRQAAGGFQVQPGPPRLKLFPDAAGEDMAAAGRINPLSSKLVIPLGAAAAAAAPRPLRAVYLLAPRAELRSGRVILRRMAGPAAFRALMTATYNNYVESGGRLVTQFGLLTALAGQVPVCRLSYPRALAVLPRVRERILAHACA